MPICGVSQISKTLERDGQIIYEISAADRQDSNGLIQWEPVGRMIFTSAILSSGVDQNLLFPHDTLNSKFTGQPFEIPAPSKQWDSIPQDIQ